MLPCDLINPLKHNKEKNPTSRASRSHLLLFYELGFDMKDIKICDISLQNSRLEMWEFPSKL